MRLSAVLPVLALVPCLHADVVEIVADRDNTLFEDAAGALSSGSGPALFAGANSMGNMHRALLHFGLEAIPAGATIQSVELVLEMEQTNGGDEVFDLHRVDSGSDWGEGASVSPGGSGAPAERGDATWLHTVFPACHWSTVGGDFEPTPSATLLVGAPGTYTFADPQLAQDVQDWLDGVRANRGWLLKHVDEVGLTTAKRFGSREHGTPAARPFVRVHFTPGPGCGWLSYCGPAVASSTGCPATIAVLGSCTVTDDDLTLVAENLPVGRFGVFLASLSRGTSIPMGSSGRLCLGAPVALFDKDVIQGPTGTLAVDLGAVQPGETWHFQCWYRDSGATSNFTDAVSVTFD